MNQISFSQNSYNNKVTPELQKRMDSEEQFGAIDKEKLKQGSIDLAKNTVKDNWATKILRDTFGIEDPKKTFKSIVFTLISVTLLAVIGNKAANPTAKLGLKVDDFLKNNKIYKNISGLFTKIKTNIGSFFKKSETIKDISDTFETKFARPKANMTRGYGQGFVSIFSLTPVDTLKKGFAGKTTDEIADSLKKLVGDEDALKFAKMISEETPIDVNKVFCNDFSNAIRKNFNCKDNKDFFEVLQKLQKGDYGSEFCNIHMKEKGIGGIIGSWWPVNLVDSIGKKVTGGKWKNIGRGNLGDSLIKFNSVNGTLADTKLGSLVQNSVIIPTESISNFVNDKSGLGVMLGAAYINLFNNVQDAPKEKKTATLADDWLGTIGSIAISTPLAFKATYGLASLANLEGKTVPAKVLKGIGKFFNMGLSNKTPKTALGSVGKKLAGLGGGALRFVLIMFVFSSIFSKPIRAGLHKIFGEPYDKDEEERKKQQEMQLNQIIPELGITQGEFIEKINNNPEIIQKIEKSPELMQRVQEDPRVLLDLLDGKELKPKKDFSDIVSQDNYRMSDASIDIINKRNNTVSIKPNSDKSQDKSIDNLTYIPSSAPAPRSTALSEEQLSLYNSLMANSDKILEQVDKIYKYP